MEDNKQAIYTQIGTPLSLYSGKMRSYLIHKGIPFIERGSNPWEFSVRFKQKLKAAAIPVIITPQGEIMQDTSCMIDELERRFPDRPALPEGPVLQIASYLFEIWGDEFWLSLAMHTRWSHRQENLGLFVSDCGDFMLQGFPRCIKNVVGRRFASKMIEHTPGLGINAESAPLFDRFLQTQLDGLDTHFSTRRFLFGDRPCLGDYGMIGPLYAHIGRDPWSKRELVDPRPHLKAWIERMFDAGSSEAGEFQAEDTLPATLEPALRSIFDEMLPFLESSADAVRNTPTQSASVHEAPRWLDMVSYPLAGGQHERKVASYIVWMAQRMMDALGAMPLTDQEKVQNWLFEVGGEALLELELPRVARVGLSAVHIVG
jgi:glutathione S-transferase